MIRKPWPIIFISFIFFLIPIFNIISTYFIFKIDYQFSDYIYNLAFNPKNYWSLFDMVVPSLLAGIAIYCVKKWSYPVFLVCMFWLTFQMFNAFSPHFKFKELIFTLLLPMVMNIFYISYILLPKFRAAYYDPRLRWWETKPRYVFSCDINIGLNRNKTLGKMTNISEGGLFSLVSIPIEPNTLVEVQFEILGTEIELEAKIVYRKPDGVSHGLQFINVTKTQQRLLKNTIAKLKKDKYELTRPIPVWTEDLTEWFVTLVTTGKGFVPEISQNQTLIKK